MRRREGEGSVVCEGREGEGSVVCEGIRFTSQR